MRPPAPRRRNECPGAHVSPSTAVAVDGVFDDVAFLALKIHEERLYSPHQVYNSHVLSSFLPVPEGKSMQSIPVGTTGSFSLLVLPEHLASRFKDVTLPPVLATPVMIMVMENAALNAIKPYLDAGESALGTRVDVRHLAATPAGRRITGEAQVTLVDGRRIEFSIRATDAGEEIGVGAHERVVIQLSKLSDRMKAKFG